MAKFKPLSDQELKAQFIKEVREHLVDIESSLLSLEKKFDHEERKKDIISHMFRSFHGIKGVSDIVGIEIFRNISHEIETFLDDVRSKNAVNINKNNIKSLTNTFIKAHDFLLNLLMKYKDNESFGQADEENADEIIKAIRSYESDIPEEDESKTEEPETKTSSFANIVLEHIEAIKTGIKIILNLKGGKSRETGLKRTKRSLKFLMKSAKFVNSSKVISFSEDLENILKKIEQSSDEEMTEIVRTFLKKINELEEYINHSNDENNVIEEKTFSQKETQQLEINENINIKISDIDKIMSDISDLIILKNTLGHELDIQNRSSNQTKIFNSFNKVTQSLQEKVLDVRMVPVSRLFGRVPRILRDICKELDKEVNLEILGETTKLDCNVIDHLLDPLVHLIRNAVDHGIEKSKERIKINKPKAGNLTLRAYQRYNNILIDVYDDGAGLNIEKIKKKALATQLVTKDALEEMSENDIIQFIFDAGFSTKIEASKISGRGVGLDIVKEKVTKLGGSIKVNTEKGNGTNFSISVPLTMVMNSLVIVKSDQQLYALPRERIIENIQYRPYENNMFSFREEVLPLLFLDKIYQNSENKEDNNQSICILDSERGKFGLAVDNIYDTGEFMIKPLPSIFSNLKTFSGITILGDGNIVFILEIDNLIGQNQLM